MMKRATEDRIRVTLTEAIEGWLDEFEADNDFPYVGKDISQIMAEAALSVLRGMADMEAYLRDNEHLQD